MRTGIQLTNYCVLALLSLTAAAREAPGPVMTATNATMKAEVGQDGGRIVIEATGVTPEAPVFFNAATEENVRVSLTGVSCEVAMKLNVVQGRPEILSLGLGGTGELESVTGEGLAAWAVRRAGGKRFLDLEVEPDRDRRQFRIVARGSLSGLEPPVTVEVLHVQAGEAVGFTSTVAVHVPREVSARLVAAEGFLPLESGNESVKRFEGARGERLSFALARSSAVAAPVEFVNASLEGVAGDDDRHAEFVFRATAEVSKDDAAVDFLRGRATVSGGPEAAGCRLALETDASGEPVYRLHFPKPGRYPIEVGIAARLGREAEWRTLGFEISSGAVVPVELRGVDAALEFHAGSSVVPSRVDGTWRGFLPLDGRLAMRWKRVRETGEGKLFFTTSARVNVGVGAGLMRETTVIDYRILQGKLEAIRLGLDGPGEVLSVEGSNVMGWRVADTDGSRSLEVELNQPLEGTGSLRIRSQLPLGAFPVRADPLRILPDGSIRHSGYVRVYNIGATRIEVAGLEGLTQLSPEQFPEQDLAGGDRQVFVYRFPSAAYECEVAADRVQPEVNVSQILVYELTETDRAMRAAIELDIREAPLREWDLMIPADYAVVSVTGAEVVDHHPGTQVENGERSLKVTFGKEVEGRQLVRVHLEKNEPAADGPWTLPLLRYPAAKSVRGEAGVASAPGYRIAVENSAKLTEIPLSRFHESRDDLQQAFRIRGRDWSVTLRIESLPQSVQADVFHLYALEDRTAYASVLLNYFVTGAPVSEWKLKIPPGAENVCVEGLDVRSRRPQDGELVVSLHQPVVGPYTLLVTYQEAVAGQGMVINPGMVEPLEVRGERGYIQVVSSVRVNPQVERVRGLIELDPLELPAELRLLSSAPALATYQYTSRPFELAMNVDWFDPAETLPQVVEFAEAASRVSQDGEVVTEVAMIVKSRGRRVFRVRLPEASQRWAVQVNGEDVSAREDGRHTLIPLPAGVGANAPVEVKLRLGNPSGGGSRARLELPAIEAPVLKTKWTVRGEHDRVLVPKRGGLPLRTQVLSETGLEWIADRALGATVVILLFVAAGVWMRGGDSRNRWPGLAGILLLTLALVISLVLAARAGTQVRENLHGLEYSLPVIAPGGQLSLEVGNYTPLRARFDLLGVAVIVAGLGLLGGSVFRKQRRLLLRWGGIVVVAIGLLMQRGGAVPFFVLLAIALAFLLLPWLWRWGGDRYWEFRGWLRTRKEARKVEAGPKADDKEEKEQGESGGPLSGPSTASLVILGLILGGGAIDEAAAGKAAGEAAPPPPVLPEGLKAAERIQQDWTIAKGRLQAGGSIRVGGEPGDTFLLLKAPAILKKFEGGEALRVGKRSVPGFGTAYVVSIRGPRLPADAAPRAGGFARHEAAFAFEMQAGANARQIAVPTGPAAVQELGVQIDRAGWEIDSEAAMRVEGREGLPDGHSGASLLLAPRREASIILRPKVRDVAAEKREFFVEVANLYLPGPGVVDGRHVVRVRPSRGLVRELAVTIPEGFTVSEAGSGPVRTWQFDAGKRELNIVIEPAQAEAFSLVVETQGRLDPLPSETELAPLAVPAAVNEVGLLGVAFGPETQLEKAEPEGLSEVNLADFDRSLIPERGGSKPVLRGVYRYGKGGGSLRLRVAPVAPELRVTTRQVVSIGDERLVVGVNFKAEIMRAGVFRMSFPLPPGLEIESLSGPALSHWTELTEEGARYVIMHLNGKTIGEQEFALSMTGPAPAADPEGWLVPRFELREAGRQTGELVLKPTKGIRLETMTRRNVSEVDPRTIGGQGEGALAFRILQRAWELRVAIEKLEPWVTGRVLHEAVLREGQTRTNIVADLNVENASIRSLDVRLPGLGDQETRTVRASGGGISSIARIEENGDLWRVQFKRRVVGPLNLRLEWERTAERPGNREALRMVEFPGIRQTPPYYFAIRSGARLDPDPGPLPEGWQQLDWNAVPQELREARNRSIPALALRAVPPATTLTLAVRRHAVAEALKLRVAGGRFTTVVSPVGKLLTAVELDIEVVQRSTLRVGLPEEGRLYNAFVNGASVSIVRQGSSCLFYVLPGPDDETAEVRFVYSTPGESFRRMELRTPELNVPLENIEWKVIVPQDYELVRHDGSLDLRGVAMGPEFDREQYLAKSRSMHDRQEAQGQVMLAKVNEDLNQGRQKKAARVLETVAGNYALDAASNEDARVQLRALREQQAIVGLNTRRQRFYLDNKGEDPGFQRDAQLEQAADNNGIINRNDVRFRPQEITEFTKGNPAEVNTALRIIAEALVDHQRAAEPAPQAITVTLPEEGRVFSFHRTVKVEKDAPMELDLRFRAPEPRSSSREALVMVAVIGLCTLIALGWKKRSV